jgi:hypothetical protein
MAMVTIPYVPAAKDAAGTFAGALAAAPGHRERGRGDRLRA